MRCHARRCERPSDLRTALYTYIQSYANLETLEEGIPSKIAESTASSGDPKRWCRAGRTGSFNPVKLEKGIGLRQWSDKVARVSPNSFVDVFFGLFRAPADVHGRQGEPHPSRGRGTGRLTRLGLVVVSEDGV